MTQLFEQLPDLLHAYGYWLIAAVVLLESMGIPLPGETILLGASAYAGATHELDIVLVIASTVAGAVIGDNIGYWVGDKVGYRLLFRYGDRFGLSERKIKLGQYLFLRHGGKVVFFGRFVAVLRALAALMAGVNRMPWGRFVVANLFGAVLWASAYGMAAFALGEAVHRVARPVGLAAVVFAAAALVASAMVLKKREQALEEEAVRALPGPLPRP
ncbi:DedA family protein [Alsobacter sp. SYSU M60028]|uniref:DedA family protein n=1 Tax=Alsobacter ponti TaxID=2962936 RepID=A0ABT1L7E1_9HYPH|nr:DedA family protein [Alsobacter ponti]